MLESNIIYVITYLILFFTFYSYLIYPAILAVLSKLIHNEINPVHDNPIDPNQYVIEEFCPEITILIAAYNEENMISGAIDSVFNDGYPIDKIHLIVGSDGSTDKTNMILEELRQKYSNIEYHIFNRIGKNSILNNLIKEVQTELVFFMDADLRIKAGSLAGLVSKFENPQVGTVIASFRIFNPNDTDNAGIQGETFYQKFETFLLVRESKIYSTINSFGMFGIRTEYYRQIPNNLVCDDFHLILQAAYFKKRIIYDDKSVVMEVREKSLSDELQRKIRTTAGGFSTLWANKALLKPKYGWISYFLWSHKLLRWFSPAYLIVLLIVTLLLPINSYLFQILTISQLLLYFSAFLGWIFEKVKIKFLLFRISLYFISINYALFLGFIRFIKGKQNAIWERIDT